MGRYGHGDGKPAAHSVAATQLKDIEKQLPLRALSPADWKHWTTWGYVVVKNAVPIENVRRLVDLLWEFQEMDPKDPSSWYRPQLRDNEMKELNNSGMVELYNHQYLWDNRQQPRVHDAFVDIWDQEALWVTIDRANLNPPNRHQRSFTGFIHWDADTRLDPLPIGVQGVLSLADTDPDVGGFQCVPELFRTLEQWRETQPAGRNGWVPDTAGFDVVNVPMRAGDLLIFNTLLAHGIRPNRSENRVRLAQYISMAPALESNEGIRNWRIRSWRDREAPKGFAYPGDPRQWEKTRYERAQLTPLGEKLLGLKRWKEESAAAE
ncbi:MAG TPA: phytanoyl-CoA dioxygenase family protein [Dongiaceae bacterium]|nr:phytanoyl-CoA dioxygenase family protein [Dongiaceae bacterium]